MRIEYHRTLIADRVRNAAFKAALARLIEPGRTVVADIGAGTGLIGLMAARLGAREVYLYETAEVAGVAAEVLKRNKVRNCHLMPCHSTEMVDPPRVDLVVSETLGNYALEEDIVETLNDAQARHLKPGGRIVPRGITQWVAPVVSERIHRELCVWDETGPALGLALDLAVAKSLTFNNAYVRALEPGELLDRGRSAKAWDEIDLTRRAKAARRGEAGWKLTRPSHVYGFAAWWVADLADGVALSTGPEAPRTHWDQLYFPLETPLDAAAGETIAVSLGSKSSRKSGTHLSWTATRSSASGRQLERRAHDLDKGYLP